VEYVLPVLIALIGGGAVVVAAWLPVRNLDRRNTAQHDASMRRQAEIAADVRQTRIDVTEIRDDVKEVRTEQDRHLGWHRGRGDDIA
jgi:hypothetical protein